MMSLRTRKSCKAKIQSFFEKRYTVRLIRLSELPDVKKPVEHLRKARQKAKPLQKILHKPLLAMIRLIVDA